MSFPRIIPSHGARLFVLCAGLALSLPLLLAADEDEQPPAPPPPKPFPEIVWQVDNRVPRAWRVFPSGVDPDTVIVSSAEGLWRTGNDARDWELVPKTGPDELGTILHLVICPARPEFVVLGSLQKGVFVSQDGAATWQPAGGVANGLAAEKVHHVDFSPEDRSWNTLLACHGTDAPGISKSLDGGQHWRVLAPSRYFRTLALCGQVWFASSAPAGDPDSWEIARSQSYGEVWHTRQRDVMPVAGAQTTVGAPRLLWGTLGGRLLCSADDGESFAELKAVPEGRWNSVFVTCGRTPHEEWFWAYDPFTHGLLSGADFESPWTSHNRGLYVHRMVTREANVAANANGTRFYACVNGSLYVGQRVGAPDVPFIVRANADPPVLGFCRSTAVRDARNQAHTSAEAICQGAPLDPEIEHMFQAFREARDVQGKRRFKVKVRVDHPEGPAAVQQVSVVPDLFGLGQVPLFDDGQHDDGAPGDGLWGGEFTFVESGMWDTGRLGGNDGAVFPGVRGIPVTAVDKAGKTATWTLVLGVFFEPKPYEMWHAGAQPPGPLVTGYKEGNVSIEVKGAGGLEGKGTLEIKGGPGPWLAYWGTAFQAGGRIDITPFQYVTFKFRGLTGAADVSFFLVDELTGGRGRGEIEAVLPKSFSDAVPLVKGGYLPAMDDAYHEVTIPLLELVRDIRFMRRHVAGFGLRAAGGAAGGTYCIDEVRLTHGNE